MQLQDFYDKSQQDRHSGEYSNGYRIRSKQDKNNAWGFSVFYLVESIPGTLDRQRLDRILGRGKVVSHYRKGQVFPENLQRDDPYHAVNRK
jgi:hypothetical protein